MPTSSKIREHWPRIRRAIERGVDLANPFGIDRDNLTSANALIPSFYYLFKNPGTSLRGSTPFEARSCEEIRQWLIMALLNGVFGGTSDNMLRDIRANLYGVKAGDEFPIDTINMTVRKAGRSAEFDDFALDEMHAHTYRQQQTFLALSLPYDDANWGTMHFTRITSSREACLNRESSPPRERWIGLATKIGSESLFAARIREHKEAGYGRRRMVEVARIGFPGTSPHSGRSDTWAFERFPEFLQARERRIRHRMKAMFGTMTAEH